MKQLAHLYVLSFLALCVGAAIGHFAPKPDPECVHQWTKWESLKSEQQDVRKGISLNLCQRRTCEKCGWTMESYNDTP